MAALRPSRINFIAREHRHIYYESRTKTIRSIGANNLEEWILKNKGEIDFHRDAVFDKNRPAMYGTLSFKATLYGFEVFYRHEKLLNLESGENIESARLKGYVFAAEEHLVLIWRKKTDPHQEILDQLKEFGYVKIR